jgi:hypothetical protein
VIKPSLRTFTVVHGLVDFFEANGFSSCLSSKAVLLYRVHSADMVSIQKRVAVSGIVFSRNGIVNRRKGSRILVLKWHLTSICLVGFPIRRKIKTQEVCLK